jgi:hypothetical protein
MDLRARLCCACLVAGLGCPFVASASFATFSVGGDDNPASIQATVDAFRSALGSPNGNNPGPLPDGRREINWDGGGATTAATAGTPFAGFQNTRGALFTTPGTGFLQTPLDAQQLDDLNPLYETTFGFFSPLRIFTALGSNFVDATFTIPGHPQSQATVDGFGAVFTDVDLPTSAAITFFDIHNNVIFSQNVLPGTVPDGSLSFLGAIATGGERIVRVRLMQGTTPLGPADNPGGGVDIVAFDDYLYAEPVPVPEPSVLGLLAATALAILGCRRKGLPPRAR